MKAAASELKVDIEWGGDWVTFKDGPHYQLSRRSYP
jgi:peptidoglycan L-alanyl-D-glutamate endopeptidase CwlK